MYLIIHGLIYSRSPGFWLVLLALMALPVSAVWIATGEHLYGLLHYSAALASAAVLRYGLVPGNLPLWCLWSGFVVYLLAALLLAARLDPNLAGTVLLCGLALPWVAYAAWHAMDHEGWR